MAHPKPQKLIPIRPAGCNLDPMIRPSLLSASLQLEEGFATFLRRARDTLPETNSSPLKMGHPKRKLVFQPSIFRGYVSFREGRMEIGEAKSKFYPNLIQTWQRINAKSDVFLWLVSTPFKGKNHKWKNCTELFRCSSDVLCPSSKLMAWEGAKIVTRPRR